MAEETGQDIGAKMEFLFGPALITRYRLLEGIQSKEAGQTAQLYTSALEDVQENISQFRTFRNDPLVAKLWAEIVTKGQQLEASLNRTGYFTGLMVPEITSDKALESAYNQMCSLFHTYLQVLDVRERLLEGKRLAEVGPTETEVPMKRTGIASLLMKEEGLGEKYPILNPMLGFVSKVADDLNRNHSKYHTQGQKKKARK